MGLVELRTKLIEQDLYVVETFSEDCQDQECRSAAVSLGFQVSATVPRSMLPFASEIQNAALKYVLKFVC